MTSINLYSILPGC